MQKDTGTSNGTIGTVIDNNDGTYTATFRGTVAGSARKFKVFVNGYPIASTMPEATVSALGPNCLSYKNNGYNTSGVYNLDTDGAAGAAASFQAYCDMVTHGGGWTLAAVPRSGVAPFSEVSGLLSPAAVANSRNANIWSGTSQFEFSQIRVTDGSAAAYYSIANFQISRTMSALNNAYPTYSQNNVAVGGSSANAAVSSNIGSTCFVFRGKSDNVTGWNDSADYLFMGFHGGAGCANPLNLANNWDRTNVAAQWLISGYDGLDSLEGPEGVNSFVGQNLTGSDWTNQDNTTLIWLK